MGLPTLGVSQNEKFPQHIVRIFVALRETHLCYIEICINEKAVDRNMVIFYNFTSEILKKA